MKTARRELGDEVEQRALRLLEAAGLKLLQRQFNHRFGEIDLILEDGEVLVFAEVRYRSHSQFGGALASVDRGKQARLIKAARMWLALHPAYARHPVRLDVIAAEGALDALKLDWIRDAFRT